MADPGATSVTCRLLMGGGPEPFGRSLYRVHCEGQECAADSPDSISLDDVSSYVNAWVAVDGVPASLRRIVEGVPAAEDLARYQGLEAIQLFRPNIRSELCVPVCAKGRLVGTINLESDRFLAFDSVGGSIEEYAQLVGAALLDSRRKIGVSMMAEAGGFLERRHLLEGRLDVVTDVVSKCESLTNEIRSRLLKEAGDVKTLVLMDRPRPTWSEAERGPTLTDVVQESLMSLDFIFTDVERFRPTDCDSDAMREIGGRRLSPSVASSLAIAVGQALLNVRKHGSSGLLPDTWQESCAIAFDERIVGGVANVGIAVHSWCYSTKLEKYQLNWYFVSRSRKMGGRPWAPAWRARSCGDRRRSLHALESHRGSPSRILVPGRPRRLRRQSTVEAAALLGYVARSPQRIRSKHASPFASVAVYWCGGGRAVVAVEATASRRVLLLARWTA
jgi:hypothetical protein